MQFNIPICLTIFRIILIPFFAIVFYLPFHQSAFITALIFLIAAITDWFDGFLARRWNQITHFGEFLDPVADKIMVVIALVIIIECFHVWWITLPAATIIIREIIISGLRELMADIGKRKKIAVSSIAKIKTMLQMLSLFLLLWRPDIIAIGIGVIGLYIAAFLTFWSMFQYLNVVYIVLFYKIHC
ncbi:CDP-diacylglycerol--glycerol-3-phosphate 3-phosphatidyltransferase [Pantoea sp. Aalb]|uniref:CDP-diacylglycerol--glycerol-3-phosphate 3-phosphatidyltransferase n=1 Tax=Pantoea sp. Aalb TaxID=2576762 RepID=UPI001328BA53|nr:CDP-diacylglycerol--glycerol-3-phosphate 3-phosphatidyltransferase [Pantoea sp. Aalb]MXP67474.1 CDP-diacylglycerol--glycerol-3-phosphate 3-phosphatidyltransferase [Pantoea sp. Aalb]